MPTPKLNPEQLEKAGLMLTKVRQDLLDLSTGDRFLLFAYCRKIWMKLQYDERGKPVTRKMMKLRTSA
jgi:UTP:GlnB (protein PII) uridylyltransferase